MRALTPLVIALLSLGFLGQWPNAGDEGSRRHISSCEDPSLRPTGVAMPTAIFSFVQDDYTRQAAESYSLFLQALQVNASLFSLAAPSMYGYPVPLFPSFATPVDHYVAPVNLDASQLAWGGGSLLTDPRLQYLIHPTPSTSQSAAKGSLDALVDFPVYQNATVNFSVGNAAIVAPAAAPAATTARNSFSVPTPPAPPYGTEQSKL